MEYNEKEAEIFQRAKILGKFTKKLFAREVNRLTNKVKWRLRKMTPPAEGEDQPMSSPPTVESPISTESTLI